MNKKTLILAIASLLVLGGPSAAFANSSPMPSGCSLSPIAPYLDKNTAKVAYSGSGNCANRDVKEMVTTLWHNYDVFPDAWADDTTDWTGPKWTGGNKLCDGGGSTQYYTETAYYRYRTSDTYRTSSMKTFNHC